MQTAVAVCTYLYFYGTSRESAACINGAGVARAIDKINTVVCSVFCVFDFLDELISCKCNGGDFV